jgi:hypothetical protein
MKEKDEGIAHPGMVSKPEKHLILAQFSNSPWTASILLEPEETFLPHLAGQAHAPVYTGTS